VTKVKEGATEAVKILPEPEKPVLEIKTETPTAKSIQGGTKPVFFPQHLYDGET